MGEDGCCMRKIRFSPVVHVISHANRLLSTETLAKCLRFIQAQELVTGIKKTTFFIVMNNNFFVENVVNYHYLVSN